MAKDGRKNNGGKRAGAGNPGYGTLQFIKDMVDKHGKLWWREWEKMMRGKSLDDLFREVDKKFKSKEKRDWLKYQIGIIYAKTFDEKKFAMQEFNKLQAKMAPQDLSLNVNKSITDIIKDIEDEGEG